VFDHFAEALSQKNYLHSSVLSRDHSPFMNTWEQIARNVDAEQRRRVATVIVNSQEGDFNLKALSTAIDCLLSDETLHPKLVESYKNEKNPHQLWRIPEEMRANRYV
jgi:hypothetical protein